MAEELGVERNKWSGLSEAGKELIHSKTAVPMCRFGGLSLKRSPDAKANVGLILVENK